MKKITIAAKYSLRVSNRYRKNPVIGITIPIISIKPVVSHCTVVAEILNDFISVGNAVVSMVEVKKVLNVPINRVKTKARRLYGRPFWSRGWSP